jgi:tRNA threonylcarbamoyladenosine dehydratase
VAGCGSTGGASIDGLVRLGVQKFVLLDNGQYDLNNLNRQMVFQNDIGRNKAVVQAERIIAINPYAEIAVVTEGVTNKNIDQHIKGSDFIFDAVDVTTKEGMEAKLHLHESAFANKIGALSALDLGFSQWVKGYNYHQGEALLEGRYDSTQSINNPLKQLIHGFCGYEDLDYEIAGEAIRLIENPAEGACQMGCACFLLSALMTPLTLQWIHQSYFPDLIKFNLLSLFENDNTQKQRKNLNRELQTQLKMILDGIA